MISLLLVSETRRVSWEISRHLMASGCRSALVIDSAGVDQANRGGSAARLLGDLGIPFEVRDILREGLPDLGGFDAIHMSGGNPFRLLKAARLHDLQSRVEAEAARRDITVIGASAGAMVTGLDIGHARILAPDLGLADASGFGWAPGRIMPHVDMAGRHGDVIRQHLEASPAADWIRLRDDDILCMEAGRLPAVAETDAAPSIG
jgi:peptidase E